MVAGIERDGRVRHARRKCGRFLYLFVLADPDDVLDDEAVARGFKGPPPEFWEPRRKQDVHIRLDSDVVRWFKEQGGRGYQTRINAVLRAFVDNQKKPAA